MNFGEVLSKAWKITWKFKVLWIFGVFASCGTRGSGSNFQTSGGNTNVPPGFIQNMERALRFFENPAVIAGLIGILCIIFLVSILLSTIGRIGLIKGTLEAEAGAQQLTFSGLWNRSLPYFWRSFWLSLLVGLPIFMVAMLTAVVVLFTFLTSGSGASFNSALFAILPILCLFFCVIFIFALALGIISNQAQIAIVHENESVLGSLRRGWDVIVNNIGPMLVMLILMFAIGLAAGLVIALPIIIIVFPLLFAFVLSSGNANMTLLIIAGLCIVAYIPISLVANGILTAYSQSVWTLTYVRLAKPRQDLETPIALPTNA